MTVKYKHIMVRKKKDHYSCWSKYSGHRIGTFKAIGSRWFYENWGETRDNDYPATLRCTSEWNDISDFLGRLIAGFYNERRKGKT